MVKDYPEYCSPDRSYTERRVLLLDPAFEMSMIEDLEPLL
jgi:hypothetical protein